MWHLKKDRKEKLSHLFGDLNLLASTAYSNYCFKIKFTTQVIKTKKKQLCTCKCYLEGDVTTFNHAPSCHLWRKMPGANSRTSTTKMIHSCCILNCTNRQGKRRELNVHVIPKIKNSGKLNGQVSQFAW